MSKKVSTINVCFQLLAGFYRDFDDEATLAAYFAEVLNSPNFTFSVKVKVFFTAGWNMLYSYC